MTFAIFGLLSSIAGAAYGVKTDNGPLMVLAFIAFGLALFCFDRADSRQYARHSEALNAFNVHRAGSHHER